MVKYFGGEYELVDTDLPVSTIEARVFFLEMLALYKPNVIEHFLRLANRDSIPNNYLEDRQFNKTLNLFFMHHLVFPSNFSIDMEEFGISKDIRKTPILSFVEYVFSNQDEYVEIEKEVEHEYRNEKNNRYFPELVEEQTLIKQFPIWSELQKKEKAKDLCAALEDWVEKWNLTTLTDDWVLDFAIDMLRNFRAKFLNGWENDFKRNSYNERFFITQFNNWLYSNGDWDSALLNLRQDGSSRQFHIAVEFTQPAFTFEYSDIKISETWFPNWKHKKVFREEMMEQFNKKFFIRLTERLEIKLGTKSRFEKALTEYIREVDLKKNKNFRRSPRKNTGERHFLWLIDYQIPPCKNYRQIARENNSDIKTVREGIARVAEQIGLKLRKKTSGGRPKGATTKQKSGLIVRK